MSRVSVPEACVHVLLSNINTPAFGLLLLPIVNDEIVSIINVNINDYNKSVGRLRTRIIVTEAVKL